MAHLRHLREPSARSAEHHRRVPPSSATRQRQGLSNERDNCTGSPTAVEVLERTRRAHQCARETTLRRRQRLLLEQRKVQAAERAEQEAAAAITRAQVVVGWAARARDSVAAATPRPPARVQSVNSRSERPGDDAFLDGSVTFMASSARVEYSAKLRAVVLAIIVVSQPRPPLLLPRLLPECA